MKLAPVSSVFNTGKTSPKGVPIWQATIRKDGKDSTCTGAKSEVESWVNKSLK